MGANDTKSGVLAPGPALAVVGGAMALIAWSGKRFSPTPDHPRTLLWYLRLNKPAFTPPGPVFGGAWGIIELLLAVSGYRLLRRPATTDRNVAVGLWGLNTLLIAGWSALFFGKKALGTSAATSAGMIAVATTYCAVAAKTDKAASMVAAPLIAWLGFATLLAEEVWRRND